MVLLQIQGKTMDKNNEREVLATKAAEPVLAEARNAEPVAWGLLSIQEPELTNSAELAVYWLRKGRVVTPLYAAPTAGVSIVEWLNSIDADGYRTDQERMAARILAKIAPSAALATSPAPSVKKEAAYDHLVIALGKGLIEVGQGHEGSERLPAILFGRNGAGAVGIETEGDRIMKPGECIAAITFGNVESLDVVAEKIAELRARIWPDAAPSASQGEVKVPEGFALVPKDPTPEMVHAARFYSGELPTTAATCYRAMIAAAPAPSVMDGEKK